MALSAALFALVAIILVLAGIFAFLNLRRVAKVKAEKIAKIVAEKIAKETAGQYIVTNIDAIIREYVTVMPPRDGVSSAVGDQIAKEEGSDQPHEGHQGNT